MTISFVFPGQGSQSIGMLAELAETQQTIKTTFEEASDALGYDLWQLVQNGPEEDLNNTTKTQPALLTSSVATWRVWNELTEIKPTLMAGHSLGEFSALVCSGAINFADAVQLVADRGAYMQEAVPVGVGSMAAILGLEDAQVEDVCSRAAEDQTVSAANFNSTGQIVIAGHKEAVERAVELAKEAGAKRSVILPVSVPSHCALMENAAEKLAKRLQAIEINSPEIPVLHNINAQSCSDVSDIKQALTAQLCEPVLWVKTIQNMVDSDIKTVVECGPGKVLSGLIKRIDRSLTILPIVDPATLEKAINEINA